MGFEPLMGSEFEFYLLTGDTHEPLFSGYHIFNTLRNDYVPTIRRILDEMPQVGRRHHHVELRVRRVAVGDQLRARAAVSPARTTRSRSRTA